MLIVSDFFPYSSYLTGWFGEAAFYHDPNVNMHFLTHYFFDIANPPTLFSMRLQIAEYGEITLR